MFDIPLHPALVHIPIGLAVIVPLLAGAITLAAWRGWLPRRSAWLVVGVQAVVLAGALLSLNTGEDEEERVEEVVSEAAIHDHEELAETFTASTGAVLVLLLVGAVLPRERLALGALGLGTLASVGALGLGLATGHAGGELVYKHGAGSVDAPVTAGGLSALTGGEGHEEEDDD